MHIIFGHTCLIYFVFTFVVLCVSIVTLSLPNLVDVYRAKNLSCFLYSLETSGPHGSESVDVGLLGCNAGWNMGR
jgi:hypothetical protein